MSEILGGEPGDWSGREYSGQGPNDRDTTDPRVSLHGLLAIALSPLLSGLPIIGFIHSIVSVCNLAVHMYGPGDYLVCIYVSLIMNELCVVCMIDGLWQRLYILRG